MYMSTYNEVGPNRGPLKVPMKYDDECFLQTLKTWKQIDSNERKEEILTYGFYYHFNNLHFNTTLNINEFHMIFSSCLPFQVNF